MAAATSMDIHERGRLSVSKTSFKNSKSSSVLKKTPPAPSPPPPSAPARPVPKVVNADPSSFRRVVQELTGTTPSSTPTLPTSSSSPPQVNASIARSSRLQRIAPPPLRPDFRNLQPQHDQQHLLQQHQLQQQSFLQQQQQEASHSLLQQHQQQQQQQQLVQNDILNQHHQQQQYQFPTVGPLSPSLSFTQFGNPNPSPYFTHSLPMLSPHLLSPLPALTPGDNTWANPLDSIPVPSQPLANPTNSIPPLLPLPTMNGETLANGHGHGYLPRPPMGIASPHGQPLPPLLTNPPPPLPFSPTSRFNWLPPWSPCPFLSPPPLSPGSFPFSPGLGPFHNITGPNSNTSINLSSPKDFTFRGPSDYIFRPC